MTNQTYAHLQQQIAALEVQAEKTKGAEIPAVIARIKKDIAAYGLTPAHLFGVSPGTVNSAGRAKSAAKGKSKASDVAKYVDGKGGQWVGRGKRPRWLSEALAAGRQLEDFLAEKFKAAVESFSSATPVVIASVESPAVKKTAKKVALMGASTKHSAANKAAKSGRASYADGAGNAWSGMGPTPKWLKQALASGKTKEAFLVKN